MAGMMSTISEWPIVEERDLLVFLGTPGVQEVCNFVWDTHLPELDAPWPHHDMDHLDVRGMIAFLTCRPDVTGFLYEVDELERYEQECSNTSTRILPLLDDETFTVMIEALP